MDRSGRMVLRLVVCGYVCYLAWSLISDQLAGKSTMNDALAYFFGALLALGSLGFGIYTIVEYWKSRPKNDSEDDPPGGNEHED